MPGQHDQGRATEAGGTTDPEHEDQDQSRSHRPRTVAAIVVGIGTIIVGGLAIVIVDAQRPGAGFGVDRRGVAAVSVGLGIVSLGLAAVVVLADLAAGTKPASSGRRAAMTVAVALGAASVCFLVIALVAAWSGP